VHGRRVLDDHHRVPFEPAVAELGDRSRSVGAESLAVGLVDPGARDDPRSILWPDVILVEVDDCVDRIGRDEPLLDQERFERRGPDRNLIVPVAHSGSR
jgi:hypothetical protein